MRRRRSSAISERIPILVFTDLDGTLLDWYSYSWVGARPALAELRRRRIPVILCTSKTRAEVLRLRRAMGNSHPFVVENGGVIAIPAGYFPAMSGLKGSGKFNTLQLGSPHEECVRALREVSRQAGVQVRSFHQMTATEIARATGLPLHQARMARQRETGEVFAFRDARAAKLQVFCRLAHEQGYTVQRGGRFWHFSAGCDKGLACSVLTDLYQLAWGLRLRTIALGDNQNDRLMLQLADCPILMPSQDGTYDTEILSRIPSIERASKPGSEGWAIAVLRALKIRVENQRATSRPDMVKAGVAAPSL